ncbi:MAG TPA: hypothetical protein VNT29_00275, partial [Candidatus Limnocylindrales bacterium]|nr:hypothetical protein [Candidatus Limnocylindrales bacterium]
WRKTWERFPFADRNEFCDDLYWFNGDKQKGLARVIIQSAAAGQMMIASIHGGNTCAAIKPGTTEWTRVPEWDEYCRGAMQL